MTRVLVLTTVLGLTVLGEQGWAYEYGRGVEAPHPNSKYWQITGQPPPLLSPAPRDHVTSLLQQENRLLREQVQLLKQQIQLLTQHEPCASHSPSLRWYEEMTTLQRTLHTLTRALSTMQRVQRTLRGF